MQDRIEKNIDLNAPINRVRLDGPFVVGEISTGRITNPGYEHLVWRAEVKAMEPERLFSYTWHPGAVDSTFDYSSEPATLVEFTLEAPDSGTQLENIQSHVES